MYFLLFSRRENIPKEGGGWGSNADLTSYLLLRCMPVLFFLNDEAGGVVMLLELLFPAGGRYITTSSLFTITYYLTSLGGAVMLLWLLFPAGGRCITTSSLFTITYYFTLAGGIG